VVADGKRHGAPGALQLVGDLDAGSGGPDDEHVTRLELAGVAIAECVQLVKVGRDSRGDGGEVGCLGGTGGDDDRAHPPRSVVGLDVEAIRCLAHAGDGGVLDDRRVEMPPVSVEASDEPGGAEVAVGLVAAFGLAGEPVHPVGREEAE
jgi:hypothetical protein